MARLVVRHARVLAVGAAAYLILVVLLRLSGKRTLAKLNAFDWIVSVAFGSTFATILLNSDVSWSEGVTALVLLAAPSSSWRGRRHGCPAGATWSRPGPPCSSRTDGCSSRHWRRSG